MKVFDIFDCDKSAAIDRKEIIQMIIATSALTGKLWETHDAERLAKQILESCDIRRIGKITKTEFINGYIKCILPCNRHTLVHCSCKNVPKYCRLLVPGYDEGMFQYR